MGVWGEGLVWQIEALCITSSLNILSQQKYRRYVRTLDISVGLVFLLCVCVCVFVVCDQKVESGGEGGNGFEAHGESM